MKNSKRLVKAYQCAARRYNRQRSINKSKPQMESSTLFGALNRLVFIHNNPAQTGRDKMFETFAWDCAEELCQRWRESHKQRG